MKTEAFYGLKNAISLARKSVSELNSSFNHLDNVRNKEEKRTIREHITQLKNSFKKINENILNELGKLNLAKPLTKAEEKPKLKPLLMQQPKKPSLTKKFSKGLSQLEKETIKRIRSKEMKLESEKVEKPKAYTQTANKYFNNLAKKLSKDKSFEVLKKDLIKTNLEFTPVNYISTMLFSTAMSVIVALFLFLFFLFFKLGGETMISLAQGDFVMRLLKTFWILLIVPIGTFFFMYFYPVLEKKSTENRINQELPFAIIHMSAISGSMIEPSKIFNIIVSTKEYPYLEKEFTKLINEINVYGYDLVSALRSTASNSPSERLTELFMGLATTINSGGDLTEFLNKRSQTLLFEYKLEREKNTKTAETFMDIYISIVIAAPMILMLLLMMMKISGLGVSLGTSAVTIMIILGVSVINLGFLAFLHLRKLTG